MSGGFLSDGVFRGRSELWKRTVSAVILGTAALGAASAGGVWLSLFWAAAGAVATHEFLLLAGAKAGEDARRSTARLACAALTGAAGLAAWAAGSGWSAAWLAALAGLIAAAVFGRFATGAMAGALRYAAAFAVGAVLALTPQAVRADVQLGLPVLLWMFAVVWATDIGAYFTGKTFGGPKLWPAVSPGKTWSGFFGGALSGVLAGMGVLVTAFDWASAMPVAIVSALASILGQGGDLAESALKRRAGVKDSGRLIPGHGGVLDRLDAFWAVAAFVAAGHVIWLVANGL